MITAHFTSRIEAEPTIFWFIVRLLPGFLPYTCALKESLELVEVKVLVCKSEGTVEGKNIWKGYWPTYHKWEVKELWWVRFSWGEHVWSQKSKWKHRNVSCTLLKHFVICTDCLFARKILYYTFLALHCDFMAVFESLHFSIWIFLLHFIRAVFAHKKMYIVL